MEKKTTKQYFKVIDELEKLEKLYIENENSGSYEIKDPVFQELFSLRRELERWYKRV